MSRPAAKSLSRRDPELRLGKASFAGVAASSSDEEVDEGVFPAPIEVPSLSFEYEPLAAPFGVGMSPSMSSMSGFSSCTSFGSRAGMTPIMPDVMGGGRRFVAGFDKVFRDTPRPELKDTGGSPAAVRMNALFGGSRRTVSCGHLVEMTKPSAPRAKSTRSMKLIKSRTAEDLIPGRKRSESETFDSPMRFRFSFGDEQLIDSPSVSPPLSSIISPVDSVGLKQRPSLAIGSRPSAAMHEEELEHLHSRSRSCGVPMSSESHSDTSRCRTRLRPVAVVIGDRKSVDELTMSRSPLEWFRFRKLGSVSSEDACKSRSVSPFPPGAACKITEEAKVGCERSFDSGWRPRPQKLGCDFASTSASELQIPERSRSQSHTLKAKKTRKRRKRKTRGKQRSLQFVTALSDKRPLDGCGNDEGKKESGLVFVEGGYSVTSLSPDSTSELDTAPRPTSTTPPPPTSSTQKKQKDIVVVDFKQKLHSHSQSPFHKDFAGVSRSLRRVTESVLEEEESVPTWMRISEMTSVDTTATTPTPTPRESEPKLSSMAELDEVKMVHAPSVDLTRHSIQYDDCELEEGKRDRPALDCGSYSAKADSRVLKEVIEGVKADVSISFEGAEVDSAKAKSPEVSSRKKRKVSFPLPHAATYDVESGYLSSPPIDSREHSAARPFQPVSARGGGLFGSRGRDHRQVEDYRDRHRSVDMRRRKRHRKGTQSHDPALAAARARRKVKKKEDSERMRVLNMEEGGERGAASKAFMQRKREIAQSVWFEAEQRSTIALPMIAASSTKSTPDSSIRRMAVEDTADELQDAGSDELAVRKVRRLSRHSGGTLMNGIYVPPELAWMPLENVSDGVISERFEIGAELGCGVSSQVFIAFDSVLRKSVTIKKMPKVVCSASAFSNEATFLSTLKDTEGVIDLYNAAMDSKFYYLVTEWAENGDLMSQVMDSANGHLSEERTKSITAHLLQTLHSLHEQGVVHRDLKPENVVFCRHSPDKPKLIDFADAVLLKSFDQQFSELCGTIFYLAPERFRKHVGWELVKSEMWTVGVFVFEMVFGKRTFFGTDDDEVIAQIVNVKYHMPRSLPASKACRHFIKHCLVLDPKERMSAAKALRHPWITGKRKKKHSRSKKKKV